MVQFVRGRRAERRGERSRARRSAELLSSALAHGTEGSEHAVGINTLHLQPTHWQPIRSHLSPILPLNPFPRRHGVANLDVLPLSDEPNVLEVQLAHVGIRIVQLTRGGAEAVEEGEARFGGTKPVRQDVKEGVQVRVVLRVGVCGCARGVSVLSVLLPLKETTAHRSRRRRKRRRAPSPPPAPPNIAARCPRRNALPACRRSLLTVRVRERPGGAR